MARRDSLPWHDRAGEPLTCLETLKVLSENLNDLEAILAKVLNTAHISRDHYPKQIEYISTEEQIGFCYSI